MSKLEEIERAAAQLTIAEKSQLLQSMARDMGGAAAGIDSHPNYTTISPCETLVKQGS